MKTKYNNSNKHETEYNLTKNFNSVIQTVVYHHKYTSSLIRDKSNKINVLKILTLPPSFAL